MSIWQGDGKESGLDGSKKRLVVFMDDSSRLIPCYGVFDSPTPDSIIWVLNPGFQDESTSREILTDNGTQVISARIKSRVILSSGHNI